MTLLAKLIAKEEGFGKAGTLPSRLHNPGDLRHSPHSQHPGGPAHKEDIGTIDTDAHGWEDLERQLRIYATEGLTLRQMAAVYAPVNDGNNTSRYLADLCAGLGLAPETPVAIALEKQA
jgi:hypothetical protein